MQIYVYGKIYDNKYRWDVFMDDRNVYRNINGFTTAYISEEIALPEDFVKSYPIDNKIQYLSKVREVFDPHSVEVVEREILASKKFWPDASYDGGKRHFYIQDYINPYKVQFKDGQVQVDLIKSPEFTQQSANIKKILITAMERLAKELNWTNTIHKISCNAIDYQFSKGASEPLNWHTDNLETVPAEHSFIILLSNPNNKYTGWNGGDLLYTARKEFKLESLNDDELQKTRPFYQKGTLLNEPRSIVWQMQSTQNDGILFGNRGMNHKVTAMEPLSGDGKRLILTLLDFGEANDSDEETYQLPNFVVDDANECFLQ